MYLYKTTIYKNGAVVINPPAGNSDNLTDWENNHKASAVSVNGVYLSDTTYEIELNFSDFDALIALPILWSDVKYIEKSDKYELNLLSEIAL